MNRARFRYLDPQGIAGLVADVLAAGLVLDDHPEAEKLRSWGMGYFKRNYFRAWQHNDGAWMHGEAATTSA